MHTETPHARRHNTNWDAMKAILLFILSINHIKRYFPEISPYLGWVTAPFGYFSMFTPFVLIAGMTTGMSIMGATGIDHRRRRLWERVKSIYSVHVVLLLYITILALMFPTQISTAGDDNLGRLVAHPLLSLLGVATLIHGLPMMDVLPVYLLLLSLAIVVAPALKSHRSQMILLTCSFLVWFALQFNVPGQQIFLDNFRSQNPLAFQFLFVIGLIYGARLKNNTLSVSPAWQKAVRGIDWLCVAIVTWFFAVRHGVIRTGLRPEVSNALFFPNSQLPIGMMVNTLAFARLMNMIGRIHYGSWPVFSWAGNWIGRNSLAVFGWNITSFYLLIVWSKEIKTYSAVTQLLLLIVMLASNALPIAFSHRGKVLIKDWWKTLTGSGLVWNQGDATLPFETRALLIFAAILPLLYFPGFGIEYREIKIVAFLIAGSFCCWRLATSADRLILPAFLRLAPLAFFVAGLISSISSINPGLAVQQTGIWTAAFFLFLTSVKSPALSMRRMALASVVTVTIAAALILLRTYANIILVPVGAGLGGMIGERNSCAIFMAACIPLLLSWVPVTQHSKAVRWILNLALTIVMLCILISRCRTAWVMVLLQISVPVILYVRSARSVSVWKNLFRKQLACLTVAIVALCLLPNKLHWSSSTPYQDTLLRLVSPSQSNGRLDLWRTGMSMFKSAPLLGIGTGNYVIKMRPFIPLSGTNPRVFGFLRNDLPLFNDYLQVFTETGIIGGSLFLALFLIAPVWLLWRIIREKMSDDPLPVLALISCLTISLAGMLDYPLLRCETLLLFALQAGYVVRRFATYRPSSIEWVSESMKLLASLMLILALMLGTSFGLRRLYRDVRSVTLLKSAFVFWPWDSQWSPYDAIMFEESGGRPYTDYYLASRLENWPYDPVSHLSAAEIMRRRGNMDLALQHYRMALFETDGGLCNRPTRYALMQLASEPQNSLTGAVTEMLSQCP